MADTNSSSSESNRNDWEPCPDGTVTRLVGKLRQRQRVQMLAKVIAGSCCVLSLFFVGRVLFTPGTPPPPLSHYEVTQLAEQYIRGELDEERTQLVEAHIDVCPQCDHLREDRRAYLTGSNSQTGLSPNNDSKLLAHSH